MGVSKEKLEVQLAWDNPVCMMLVLQLPGLVTALVWEESDDAAVGWFEESEGLIVGKGTKLDAAALEVAREVTVEAGSWLETAIDTVVIVGVAQRFGLTYFYFWLQLSREPYESLLRPLSVRPCPT